MIVATARVSAVALALTLGGCGFVVPDLVHERWRDPPPVAARVAPAPAEPMVGLALSGGGARAAVFAAAAIAELDDVGLARRVTHVSAVSGGAFAGAYLATHPLDTCDFTDAVCRAEHAEAFDAAMRSNLFAATLANQIAAPWRITSPTRRAVSLAEALDDAFLDGMTFGDLPPGPTLYVNASRYEDGRRFVFSRDALADDAPGGPPLDRPTLRAASFSRPGCPRPTPDELPLAFAVAASAAFPPAFGPVALAAPVDCSGANTEYWRLGDGGVIDNSGVETLEEVALRSARETGAPRRLLILAVDAGKRHGTAAMLADADVRLWTTNPGIVVDTAAARGEAYHDIVWAEAWRAAGVEALTIRLRYTDAPPDVWPADCAGAPGGAEAIAARLATIPTALSISDCDAALLRAAAAIAVGRAVAEHASALEAWGLAPAARVAAK